MADQVEVNILLICYGGNPTGYSEVDDDVTFLIRKKTREESSIRIIFSHLLTKYKGATPLILNIWFSNSFTKPRQEVIDKETLFVANLAGQYGYTIKDINWRFMGFINYSNNKNQLQVQMDIASMIPCPIFSTQYNIDVPEDIIKSYFGDKQYDPEMYKFKIRDDQIGTCKHFKVISDMLKPGGLFMLGEPFNVGMYDPYIFDELKDIDRKKSIIKLAQLPPSFNTFTAAYNTIAKFKWTEQVTIEGVETTLLEYLGFKYPYFCAGTPGQGAEVFEKINITGGGSDSCIIN